MCIHPKMCAICVNLMYCSIYFKDPTIWSHLQRRFEHTSNPKELCDVYDGAEYRRHHDFLSKPENVSVLLNTNGVSIFWSSTMSLWPLWLVINELPPSVRLVCSFINLVHGTQVSHPCTCRIEHQ